MKAYLCQTDVGPQYVHLQADAKRLDRNFKTVEIDTAKGPLLDMLNDLLRRAHEAAAPEEPVAVSRPAPPQPKGNIGTFAVGNEPPESRYQGDNHLVREGRKCNVCLTTDRIEKWRASSEVGIELENLIVSLTEPLHLERIEQLIQQQKAQLA